MPTIRSITAMTAGVIVVVAACKPMEQQPKEQAAGPGIASPDRIHAAGVAPPANALAAARPDKLNPDAGASLFGSMNCDGCHGGGRRRVGRAQPGRRPLALWRVGRGHLHLDFLWATERNAGVRRSDRHRRRVDAGGVHPGAGGSRRRSDHLLATRRQRHRHACGSCAPAAAAPAPAEQAKAVAPEDMPAKYGCTACHAVDHKVVGPAFKDVAAKYKGQDVEAKLVEKVKNGRIRVWGSTPMIPNPQVPDADLHAVVKWILTLK